MTLFGDPVEDSLPARAEPADPFEGADDPNSPLAVRMRPRTLDEVLGQQQLLGPGSPLRRLVEGDAPMSLILFGPPGTGKTTLATIVSTAGNRRFVQLSALNAGVKDVRAVIETARRTLEHGGRPTVLFIDEIHRFSKTQQDSLLAAVEARTVTLVAATTENPYFSLVSPLLSRSLLLTLQPLTDDDINQLVDRALTDPRGLGGTVRLSGEAREHLVRMAAGDARRALTALEAAAGSVLAAAEQEAGEQEAAEQTTSERKTGERKTGEREISLAALEQAVDTAAVRYDRDGDQHYDVISAFIKSIRGSDVDAALHYLARMIVAGEDPRFIARRLVVHASEDIGMADPTALLAATAAADAVALIGMPEARINLAQATIHLALAPKSNAVITAVDAAIGDVRAGLAGTVPAPLRDSHYAGAGRLGHGKRYQYPHDLPEGVATQQYPPDELVGRDYYQPGPRGAERAIAERLAKLRAVIRGIRP
ncbi:replication-associated recombination protein A [Jatrophihabitans sp.]|uniref:replication-associated recombination protein A n=1 Tax=Jatrophihabitans sp. TaxID=1932789 RepID=UPI002B7A3B7A|nr:replication-associated recombination protein A [Jatrophihabitans sp.]